MKIYQYADFLVKSVSVSADDVTAALGVKPTRVWVRGERSVEPVRPQTHGWSLRATGGGVVDELVLELLDRIEPAAGKFAQLTSGGEATATISFMRSFGDDDGVEEDAGPELPGNLVRMSGQHQLLGFHLDVDLMRRLVALDCSLDFDEYG